MRKETYTKDEIIEIINKEIELEKRYSASFQKLNPGDSAARRKHEEICICGALELLLYNFK